MKICFSLFTVVSLCVTCTIRETSREQKLASDLSEITSRFGKGDADNIRDDAFAGIDTMSVDEYISCIRRYTEDGKDVSGEFVTRSVSGSGSFEGREFAGVYHNSNLVFALTVDPRSGLRDEIFLRHGSVLATRHLRADLTDAMVEEWITEWNEHRPIAAYFRRRPGQGLGKSESEGVARDDIPFGPMDRSTAEERVRQVFGIMRAFLEGWSCVDARIVGGVYDSIRFDAGYAGTFHIQIKALDNDFARSAGLHATLGTTAHVEFERVYDGDEEGGARLVVRDGYYRMDAIESTADQAAISGIVSAHEGRYLNLDSGDWRVQDSRCAPLEIVVANRQPTVRISALTPSRITHAATFLETASQPATRFCTSDGLIVTTSSDGLLVINRPGDALPCILQRHPLQ